MRLLSKSEYDTVEELLRAYGIAAELEEPFNSAMKELITFFNKSVYKDFLQFFYFDRHKYINRYPDNRSMMTYLCNKLYIQEPTLYIVRREIVYKAAMIFYKYDIFNKLGGEDNDI